MYTSLHAVHVDSQSVTGSGTVSGVTANRTDLLFGDLLPSMDSATGVPALFAHFVGTTKSSEFLSAFMSDLPPEVFSDRSVVWCDCHPLKTETNRTSRFSRLEFPRMHRFVDSAVSAPISPIAIAAMLPSPCQDRIGTRKW